MRVVQVNTTDTIGGAGLAAYRLHQGLRSVSGIDSFLLVGISATQDADVRAVYAGKTGYRLSRLAHVCPVITARRRKAIPFGLLAERRSQCSRKGADEFHVLVRVLQLQAFQEAAGRRLTG